MRTNRLIARDALPSLDLATRVRLEREITDAIAPETPHTAVSHDWSLESYRQRSPWRRWMFDFLGSMADKTVLDLGCGYHPTSIYFALAGARQVVACDVSPRAVAHVAALAEELGVGDRVAACVAPAEQLPFADEEFDLVHGEAVLHHLDLALAGPELARVLKSGGRAAFKDPLGQNPLLEFARDYLPYRWKSDVKGTDCPLTYARIREFGRHFAACRYRGFGLVSLLAVGLRGRRSTRLHTLAHGLDGCLLSAVPLLQRLSRFVVTCVEKAGPAG